MPMQLERLAFPNVVCQSHSDAVHSHVAYRCMKNIIHLIHRITFSIFWTSRHEQCELLAIYRFVGVLKYIRIRDSFQCTFREAGVTKTLLLYNKLNSKANGNTENPWTSVIHIYEMPCVGCMDISQIVKSNSSSWEIIYNKELFISVGDMYCKRWVRVYHTPNFPATILRSRTQIISYSESGTTMWSGSYIWCIVIQSHVITKVQDNYWCFFVNRITKFVARKNSQCVTDDLSQTITIRYWIMFFSTICLKLL